MRTIKLLALAGALAGAGASAAMAQLWPPPEVAVGPQYSSTHVYVAPADFDRFVASFIATFGGTTTKTGVFTVTPTPSLAMSQLVLTPVGMFGSGSTDRFPTPSAPSELVISSPTWTPPFKRPATMERTSSSPRSRTRSAAMRSFNGRGWSEHAALLAHDVAKLCPARHGSGEPDLCVEGPRRRLHPRLPDLLAGRRDQRRRCLAGVEIGRPSEVYRRVRIASPVGKLAALVTDGHLPWPYGREVTGYEVSSVPETLDKAVAAGAEVLVAPYAADRRVAAMVRFPGGYIAEIHAIAPP